MPWWAWIFGIGIFAWCAVQLWRALALGRISAGPVDFTKAVSPVTFWIQFGIVLFGAVLIGGMMLVVAINLLRLNSN